MPDEPEQSNPPAGETTESERFPELAEMQREIARRLADNRRFLERFLDDDFPEEAEEDEEGNADDFEEL